MIDIEFTTIRGKLKGKKLVVHQICNDWVTATNPDGTYANGGQPIALRNVVIEHVLDRTIIMMMENEKKLGQMFRMYFDLDTFLETGKFKRPKITG